MRLFRSPRRSCCWTHDPRAGTLAQAVMWGFSWWLRLSWRGCKRVLRTCPLRNSLWCCQHWHCSVMLLLLSVAAVVVRDGRGPVTCPTYSSLALARVSEAGSMRHNGPLGRNKVRLGQGNAESFQNFRVFYGLWAFLEISFKNNTKIDSILNFSREKL